MPSYRHVCLFSLALCQSTSNGEKLNTRKTIQSELLLHNRKLLFFFLIFKNVRKISQDLLCRGKLWACNRNHIHFLVKANVLAKSHFRRGGNCATVSAYLSLLRNGNVLKNLLMQRRQTNTIDRRKNYEHRVPFGK